MEKGEPLKKKKYIKESFYLLRNSIVGTGVLRKRQKEGHCGNSVFIWRSHIYVFSGIACRKQQPESGRHVAEKMNTLTQLLSGVD